MQLKERIINYKNQAIQIKNKLGDKTIYIAGFIGLMILTIYIRTRNLGLLKGKYLIELDSSMFYRYANQIITKGSLFAQDAMRYVPLGYTLSPSDRFFSYCLAYGYKLVSWIGITQKEFHIWYPVIATVISFIFFFLLVRELFDNKVAAVATAFVAVIPAYIFRTGAGFADHEALAMLWMFAALWLFVKSWKNSAAGKKLWITMALSAGAGLFTGFMILTWGGYAILLAVIGLFIPMAILFSKINKRQICSYFTWFAVTTVFLYLRAENIYFIREYAFLILAFSALACGILLLSEKYKQLVPEKIKAKVPLNMIILIAALVISFIGSLIARIDLSSLISSVFAHKASSRLGSTISENITPYFTGGNGWMSSFGYTMWLILIGAVVTFYFTFYGKKKYTLLLTAGWIITLATIIFGNYAAGSSINKIFSESYIYFILAFIILFAGIYLYTYNKDKEAFESLFNSKWQLLLIIGWFVFTLIITKRSIRTVMLMAPIAAIVVGYCSVKIASAFYTKKKLVSFVIVGLVVLSCFAANAYSSANITRGSGSGFPGQWESAMTWVKTNTSEDAVFAHWWDYGYWLQTEGERATVVDGGNAMGWDHDMGRQGLLGKNPDEYLSYLKTHKVTHLLISDEEIGKFGAFANIGSDENYDLLSSIGIFSVQQVQEVRNGSKLIYGGGWGFDKDYVFGNKVLGRGDYIFGFSLDATENAIGNPTALVQDKDGQQFTLPLNCICQGGECKQLNTDGIGGCMILAPSFKSATDGNPIGAAFYASEKIIDTNLVQMYIVGKENPYFEKVYDDGTPLGLYQGIMIGPIRIWKVQYPDDAVADPKYLEPSIYG